MDVPMAVCISNLPHQGDEHMAVTSGIDVADLGTGSLESNADAARRLTSIDPVCTTSSPPPPPGRRGHWSCRLSVVLGVRRLMSRLPVSYMWAIHEDVLQDDTDGRP